MERLFTYQIDETHANMTIKDFLYRQGYSRQNLISLKKMPESILLNGKWEYVNCRLQTNDSLCVHLMENEINEQIVPIALPFPIVYEDEDIMIINKPANMPTHPSLNNYDNTLANACAYHFQKLGIPYTFRCINRLDKDTTGLTILAKHMISASLLSDMVKSRSITREYRALVSGTTPCDSGIIDAPIGRVNGSLITRQVDYVNGANAVTHYQTLAKSNSFSYVSLKLETGRTHQIRVHMAHIGCPLIGDYLYNPDYVNASCPTTDSDSNVPLMHRPALHAFRLAFRHPITNRQMEFSTPLPEDMQQLLSLITSI